MSVLISGCSSGIGKATACYLRNHGIDVIASARSDQGVYDLTQLGLKTVKLDVCDPHSIAQAVSQVLILSDQHRIDALVNNAGFGQAGALEDLDRDALRDQFETNVFGLHELTRTVLPHFLEQGQGRIINISSVLGLVSIPLSGAYNASKYAVEGLSDTLRLELHGTGISISLIEPGPIASEFRRHLLRHAQQRLATTSSRFADIYEHMQHSVDAEAEGSRFKLPAEAVAKTIYHALTHHRPKPRYTVTTPATVAAVLKRLLTTRMLDRIIRFSHRGMLQPPPSSP